MILKLLIAIGILYALYKIVRGWKAIAAPSAKDRALAGEDLVEDPLCHTYVPISNARQLSLEGKTYYFCSRKCLEAFAGQQKKTQQ